VVGIEVGLPVGYDDVGSPDGAEDEGVEDDGRAVGSATGVFDGLDELGFTVGRDGCDDDGLDELGFTVGRDGCEDDGFDEVGSDDGSGVGSNVQVGHCVAMVLSDGTDVLGEEVGVFSGTKYRPLSRGSEKTPNPLLDDSVSYMSPDWSLLLYQIVLRMPVWSF